MAKKTKEEKIAIRTAKREALIRITDYVRNSMDSEFDSFTHPAENVLMADLVLITPGVKKERQPKVLNTIRDFFKENNSIHEDGLWDEYKLGRTDMRKICKNLIKQAPSEKERIWVSFTPATGEYNVEKIGAKAPKNWKGYKPVEIEDVTIV